MLKGFEDVAIFFGEEPGVDIPSVVYEFSNMFATALMENKAARELAKKQAEKVKIPVVLGLLT